MILHGNERGFGAELAQHLMNARDNEHVTLHAIDGFISGDLLGAFAESEALSKATQCRNYLYSLSLNPPDYADVPAQVFEETISRIEQSLGLAGQPRAIIFHEKKGRRHCHCVWSRIDPVQIKAINLPHTKRRLMEISYDLYMEHKWRMPEGMKDQRRRDPYNYTHQEAGQAKRAKRDPKELKALLKQCWEQSDSHAAFAVALNAEGFELARGDRRGAVAVDINGEVYSLSRGCGVKIKELKARIGSFDELPNVEQAIDTLKSVPIAENQPTESPNDNLASEAFGKERKALVRTQRSEREALRLQQEQRRIIETKNRQSCMPRGLKALWSRLTGSYKQIVKELDVEATACDLRDERERHELIQYHLKQCKVLEIQFQQSQTQKQSISSELQKTFGNAIRRHDKKAKSKRPRQRRNRHSPSRQ